MAVSHLTNLLGERNVLKHGPGLPQRRHRVGQGTAGRPLGLVPERGPAETDPGAPPAALRRPGWVAAQRPIEERQVVNAPGNQADGVERGCQRLHAADIYTAIGRLVPEGAAVGGGADRGAAGLRAERERHHGIADSRRGTSRRSPWRVLGVVRVPCLDRRGICELGRHRLSEDDSARGSGSGDASRVAPRAVAAIDGRAILGRHVGGVDDVLDADRDAVERAQRLCPIPFAGLLQ